MMSNSRNVHSALRMTARNRGALDARPLRDVAEFLPGVCSASTRAASYSDSGIDCSAATSVIVKNGKLFHTDARITVGIAVRASTNHAVSPAPRCSARMIALMTPNDASNIHRKLRLTITPGTAHGISRRLRSQRRAGNSRLNTSARASPARNDIGTSVARGVDRRVDEGVPGIRVAHYPLEIAQAQRLAEEPGQLERAPWGAGSC